MSCAACSARVEKAVAKLPGVSSCTVNLLTGSMTVEGSASSEEIADAVRKAGYDAEPYGENGTGKEGAKYGGGEREDEEIKRYVLEQLGHGVTVFDAKGGFTKEKQKVLFCVIPTKDYFKLKEGIHEIDDGAFFVATDAYEVLGGE